MPVDGLGNSDNSSRYERAQAATLKAQPAGLDKPQRRISAQSKANLERNILPSDVLNRPRPGGAGRIDAVLDAIEGRGAENGRDRGTTDNRGEDPGRSHNRPTLHGLDDESARRDDGRPSMAGLSDTRRAFDLDEDDYDVEEAAPKRRKTGKTLQAFAEEHELEPKAVYDLEISLEAGDEPVTIGALKDHYKATRQFEQLRDDFEDYRSQSQTEIIQGRQQLTSLVQMVARYVPPTTLQEMGQVLEAESRQTIDHSRRQLREWFPEWEQPDVAKAARERMLTVVKQYGFSDVDFYNITDARLVKLLYDSIRKADRYDALRKGQREQKQPPKEAPATRRRRPSATDEAKRLSAGGDTVGGIAALIGG